MPLRVLQLKRCLGRDGMLRLFEKVEAGAKKILLHPRG